MIRLAVLAGALALAGCATPQITDTSCRSFRPIQASVADTEITKRQVVAHNRVYDGICPRKAP